MPYRPFSRPRRSRRRSPAASGPDRYYHGKIIRAQSGASGARRWYLYVLQPDYYWVDGKVIREAPTIKWFTNVPMPNSRGGMVKEGDEIFIKGKFREHSSIRPSGDLIGNVLALKEEEFKKVTGYPAGRPEVKPEPEKPKPQPCSKRVDALMESLREAKKKMDDIRESGLKELDKQIPGSAKDQDLFRRVQEANSFDEAYLETPDGRQSIQRVLPEVKTEHDVIVSPEVFLDIAKKLREHAMTVLNLAAEDPENASEWGDVGDISVTIEPFPGEQETITLKPMFEPDDLMKGPDYVENEFIVPLQAEMERAEGARAQGIPEFDHQLPFVPQSVKRGRGGQEIREDVKRVYEDSKQKFESTKEAINKILEDLGISEAQESYRKAKQYLDLARWDCPGDKDRIDKFKRDLELGKAAAWLDRSCRFAGEYGVVVKVAGFPTK